MITVVPKAAHWIKSQLEKRGSGLGIRLGVKPSGCSGFKYVLEYVDTPEEFDQMFEQHGVNIYVDPKSLIALDGMEVQYKVEGVNEGLSFVNPNVTGSCGCGESFAV
jgi:iron-sulfur cluster assembly protein